MTHSASHVIISSLKQQVVMFENGKPGWLKVWHLLAGPAVIGLGLGAWLV